MGVQTYLINLEKDRERLAATKAQLDALAMPFERVDAIHGTDMPEWIRPYFLDDRGKIASGLLPGEVGCYASHLLVLRRIAERDQPALVLEDDVEIAPDFPDVFNSLPTMPVGWEIIRLTNPYKRGYVRISSVNTNYDVVKFVNVPPDTGAYFISPEGARKFLNWKGKRTQAVDQDLRRIWDHKLTTYGIHPRPILPGTGRSSIDGMSKRASGKTYRSRSVRDAISRIAFETRWLGFEVWARSLLYSGSFLAPTKQPRDVARTRHSTDSKSVKMSGDGL